MVKSAMRIAGQRRVRAARHAVASCRHLAERRHPAAAAASGVQRNWNGAISTSTGLAAFEQPTGANRPRDVLVLARVTSAGVRYLAARHAELPGRGRTMSSTRLPPPSIRGCGH